jgi:hypothetical protein
MLTTLRRPPLSCSAAHSIAAIVSEPNPEPSQSSVRSAWMVVAGATPEAVPQQRPAQWVPWPLQSCGSASESTKS